MSSLGPGVRLHDRYRLVTLLGEGGMSQVWRAVDEVLGRAVAVKVLAAPLADDPVLHSSTWREARVAAQLGHPHVTQVYDYGEATLGGVTVPYLVLELVEGRSLAERLETGPLPWPEAARVGAQIAGALAAAHRLGLVHRDVKPGNVMLTPNGAKVLDFGIAALAGPALDGGRLIGTPAYAAPERARPGAAEPAGDVYALGAVLYEMITGRPPRQVSSWAEVAKPVGTIRPPEARGLPPRLAGTCLDCLATDPKARPQAAQVAVTLEELAGRSAAPAGSRPSRAPAPPPPPTQLDWGAPAPTAPAPPSRRAGLVGVAVAVVLAGIVLALIATLGPGTGGNPDAIPGPGGDITTTTPATTPPTTTTPPTDQPVNAAQALAILITFGEAIDAAVQDDRIDEKTAGELRDRVEDIRDRVERNRLREVIKRAEDLRDEVAELRDEEKINGDTASLLIALIEPLTRGTSDDG